MTTEFLGDLPAVDAGLFFRADFNGFSELIPLRRSAIPPF
jgi:hypothetical protein